MHEFIRVDTPESVDLALEPADLGSRFFAALIDFLIQTGLIVAILLGFFPVVLFSAPTDLLPTAVGGGIFLSFLLLLAGFLLFGYKLVLETLWNGQTIGKRAIGIRVVRSDGLPLTFLPAIIRNLMRVIDTLPGLYMIGSVAVMASERRQRLGDMVAGTMVVWDRPAQAPAVPVKLRHQPLTDLTVLREYVLRLNDASLDAARAFLGRRDSLAQEPRWRVAQRIAAQLASDMGWTERIGKPEEFIEEVLYVRAQ